MCTIDQFIVNMIKRISFVLVFVIISFELAGQSFQCGTEGELSKGMVTRMLMNKARVKAGIVEFRNNTIYLPIKFHIVAKSDGSERVKESEILKMMCTVNDDFADQNIQFYIKGGFNYINNDNVYDDHRSTERTIMRINRDIRAINIFVIDRISDNEANLGYYHNVHDWIVIRNSDINSNKVMTHEIGHFFSLIHTFGNHNSSYNPDEEGDVAPKIFANTGVDFEKADGSNCEDSGDFLCDTPADYNAFNSICEPPFAILDPDSVAINPDTKLFMAYFVCDARSDYYFSDDQKDLIRADLTTERRQPLISDNPSTTELVTEEAVNIFPSDRSTVSIRNGLDLEWTSVRNANHYLIEIADLPNFSNSSIIASIVSNENFITIDGLEPDKNYFWRVRPFNEYHTCPDFGSETRFKTTLEETTSSNEMEAVESWSLFPNPSNTNQIHLRITAKTRTLGHIKIYNSAGQEVFSLDDQKLALGNNDITLNIAQLNPGIHTLTFHSEQGYLADKLIITE